MNNQRRAFLKTAAFTALSQSRILGANDRVRAAGIGNGHRGTYILGLVKEAQNTEIVAVSDIYPPRMAAAKQKLAPDAREYPDFRELLDRKDIDAVVIGSPDHWHVPMIMAAVRAGKDVYCEKPVTHTIAEGERLLEFMASSDRIVQIGYQQRSWNHFQHAREFVTSGKLGRISLILTSWYQDYLSLLSAMPPVNAADVNWKAFLGSAPDQPFDALRFNRWRWFWDFGGGHLTDLFSHLLDVIHWYTGQDSPRAVMAMGGRNALPQFECPETIDAVYEYPAGFHVVYTGTLVGSLEGGNIVIRGSDAMMKLNRDGFNVYAERVIPFEKTRLPDPIISERADRDGTADHVKNFLECVRTRHTPNADVKSAVAAARAAHLGNQAFRTATRVSG